MPPYCPCNMPGSGDCPTLAQLLEQGKRLDAIKHLRRQTNAPYWACAEAVDDLRLKMSAQKKSQQPN